jgi:hypothetical protein
MAVGRISGPLLKDNLLRNGVDLSFETSLLYLDVNNSRVGVNTATPQYDLDVNGTTRTTNLRVTNTTNIANITISNSTISSSSSTISLLPTGANGVVYQGTITVGQLQVNTNVISSTGTNTDINISPNGTGTTIINSNTLINGNLHATGNITADGNLQLGNAPTDTVTFDGEINSDILPNATATHNLGSNSLQWNNIYAVNSYISNATISTVNTNNFYSSSLKISSNTISAISSNTDINLSTTGTGGVVIGNLKFVGNSIINVVPNAVTTFVESGTGYAKFPGTYGIVVPSGTSNNRPAIRYSETGMMRYNTDLQYMEVYNGTNWVSVAGTSSGVTFNDATDLGIEAALMIG